MGMGRLKIIQRMLNCIGLNTILIVPHMFVL